MIPIITPTRFRRFDNPKDIIPVIDHKHPAASMLEAMCLNHPRIFTREELIDIAGLKQGHVNAAFYFWIMRINDRLPRTGWRVNDVHHYRLTPISAEQAAWLEEKLNKVAA